MSRSKLSIDREAAEQVMRQAIAIAQNNASQCPPTKWNAEIEMIIQGKHLTFRYLLVTALLGKATNPKINALALQAGAEIARAYDARSLCHGVVVPLERQLLQSALGGSNEPFLNKPARFPKIDPANAVRAGKDRKMLQVLHHLLSEIETSEQAFGALCVALGSALERQNERVRSFVTSSNSQDSHLDVNIIILDLLSLVRSIVALCPDLSFVAFLQKLQNCAIGARVKDEVFEHIEQSLLQVSNVANVKSP